ncbi:hypothetical protein EPN90_00955 [Patescibacteria group bacterium]|nr:MAG: hypothetical protein EPN90_00955 [Patescibacteria group bacterium]
MEIQPQLTGFETTSRGRYLTGPRLLSLWVVFSLAVLAETLLSLQAQTALPPLPTDTTLVADLRTPQELIKYAKTKEFGGMWPKDGLINEVWNLAGIKRIVVTVDEPAEKPSFALFWQKKDIPIPQTTLILWTLRRLYPGEKKRLQPDQTSYRVFRTDKSPVKLQKWGTTDSIMSLGPDFWLYYHDFGQWSVLTTQEKPEWKKVKLLKTKEIEGVRTYRPVAPNTPPSQVLPNFLYDFPAFLSVQKVEKLSPNVDKD